MVGIPVCYGRGGELLPTVTDANLVLGHLPTTLLGGDMTLYAAAMRAHEPLAAQLGVDVHSAPQAVIDIVNGNMLGALRVATGQKGLNLREFSLLPFGGDVVGLDEVLTHRRSLPSRS